MLCLGNEQVRIIDYGTMLGDILVISRRLWVMSMLVITNYSTTLNPLALPVCRLQFSMLVGAVFSNLNHSSFRGILCDQESTLLCGFSRFIGISNSLHVELLTIMHDLKLSQDRGHDVICCPDSLHGINLIQTPLIVWHVYATNIRNIERQTSVQIFQLKMVAITILLDAAWRTPSHAQKMCFL